MKDFCTCYGVKRFAFSDCEQTKENRIKQVKAWLSILRGKAQRRILRAELRELVA